MKTTKFLLLAIMLVLFSTTGCSKYHQGPPSGGPTTQEVVPEVKQLVEQNVKDPQKAKQVQAMIQEIVNEVKKSNQQVRGFHEQLAVLNANYDAKPEEFTKILDELNNTRMQSATKILSTRFKIKDTLTAEEWKNLNDAMMKSRREHEPRPPAAMTGSSAPSSAY